MDQVTDFLLFLGKVMIAGGVGKSRVMFFFFFLNGPCGESHKRPFFFPLAIDVSGVLTLLLLTKKIALFQEEVPHLHYYEVPLMVNSQQPFLPATD